MKQVRRVSPRIPYEESVYLTRTDGTGRLLGRSVNLGVTGIYIRCAEPCEIGTEVICSVLLPGGPRKLRGRVVRIISLARGVGLAIAFSDIREGDRMAIEQLIAEHQRAVYQAKLRLDGMEQPVRCEAVLDERTVHLSTALPFLRLAADVGVVLGDGEELEASGVISKIALDPASDDGVPRLALDVQLGGGDGAGGAGDEDAAPPPSALPRPCGHPLPSVVVSRTLQREVLARAVIVGRARPATGRRVRHTAQIRRLGRFTDWTPPPVISERRTGRTERFRLVHRRLLPRRRHWRYLVFVPVVAALAAALLFGVM